MQIAPADAQARLLARGWLAHQPGAFQRQLLREGQLLRFARGQPAFRIEDGLGGIYGTVAGGFLLELCSPLIALRPAHIAREGVWFGMGPLMTRRQRVLAAVAQEDSVAWHVPLARLDALRATSPEAARCLGAVSDFAVDVAIRCVADLLIRHTDRRIAAVLLRLTAAEEGIAPPDPAGWLLSQDQLADMANASRHVVNRTLRGFVASGWVSVGYSRIRVLDVAALQGFVRDG